MRRTALMMLLSVGTVVGFGSGFASIARHHRYEGGCGAWRDGYSRWSREAPPAAVQAPAPVIVAPAAPAAAPAPSTTVIIVGGALPQAPQVISVPTPAPASPP